MVDSKINDAIARVLLSTKRKSRQYSIWEIANDILFLKNETGGLNNVSNLIGITIGMLNQFLSVYNLPEEIIELVKQKKIESVSLVYYLSKFDPDDSIKLVSYILQEGLSSQELRIILPFRKRNPNESIENVVKRVLDSKNIKVSVIRIAESNLNCSKHDLEERVIKLIGKENLLSVETINSNLDLKITKEGEKILRKVAASQKYTFKDFINQIFK